MESGSVSSELRHPEKAVASIDRHRQNEAILVVFMTRIRRGIRIMFRQIPPACSIKSAAMNIVGSRASNRRLALLIGDF